MKYLAKLITFIGKLIIGAFKLLTKIPQAVIEWAIIIVILGLLASGLYTISSALFLAAIS